MGELSALDELEHLRYEPEMGSNILSNGIPNARSLARDRSQPIRVFYWERLQAQAEEQIETLRGFWISVRA
jgi:hypothetical protein